MEISMEISKSMRTAPNRAYSWNVVLQYDDKTVGTFTDGQLLGLAQHFKQELDRNYHKWRPVDYPEIRKPAAVSVIAIGSCIYVASSIKSGNYINHHGHGLVQGALLKCKRETKSTQDHRTNANCGEQAAAHLYFTLNGDVSLTGGVV